MYMKYLTYIRIHLLALLFGITIYSNALKYGNANEWNEIIIFFYFFYSNIAIFGRIFFSLTSVSSTTFVDDDEDYDDNVDTSIK